MLTAILLTLGKSLAVLAAGYVGDRWLYKRKIVKDTLELAAKAAPDADVSELARQAVIAANMKEAGEALKAAAAARAEHEVRMSAIRSGAGEVNVGSFRK